LAVALAAVLVLPAQAAQAGSDHRPGHGHGHGDRSSGAQLEDLDRGLVAVDTASGVFLSWRLLKAEATGADATGLTGTDFVVYRDNRRIATVTDSTNFLDEEGTAASTYRVAPLHDTHPGPKHPGKKGDRHGKKGERVGKKSERVTPLGQAHIDIPLTKPA